MSKEDKREYDQLSLASREEFMKKNRLYKAQQKALEKGDLALAEAISH